MDFLKTSLFAFIALFFLAHMVLTAPMLVDGEMDEIVDVPIAMPSELADELLAGGEPTLILSRQRRNSAQWYQAAHHYNDQAHESQSRNDRRWQNRASRYRNTQGGGRLADA